MVVPDSSTTVRFSDAWLPLRSGVFRAFWFAALLSNIGTWTHETGASWLMIELQDSPLMVSLVRTAMTIPVFLLSLPAGTIADIFDRRLVLMFTQLFLLTIASTMALCTYFQVMNPTLLIALTLAMGLGMVVHVPAWQAIIPELVPREQVAAAVGLGSLSFNLARAIGPALGGLMIAAYGSWSAFALNAISFLAIFAALVAWRRTPPARDLSMPNGFFAAIGQGVKYVTTTRATRHVLIRCGLFIVSASCLWGLMPLIAVERLGFQAAGYGAMLGLFGTGAVCGAIMLPVVRYRIGSDRLLLLMALLYSLVYWLLSSDLPRPVRLAAMPLAGLSWMSMLTTLNTTAQVHLPHSYRARGMASYLMVFSASMAVGTASWGLIASQIPLVASLHVAAGAMMVSAILGVAFPIGNLDDAPREDIHREDTPRQETPRSDE